MAKGSNIRKTDVVTWVSFGVTHLPRPEDFPVSLLFSHRVLLVGISC